MKVTILDECGNPGFCWHCGKPAVAYENTSVAAASSVPVRLLPVCEDHAPAWWAENSALRAELAQLKKRMEAPTGNAACLTCGGDVDEHGKFLRGPFYWHFRELSAERTSALSRLTVLEKVAEIGERHRGMGRLPEDLDDALEALVTAGSTSDKEGG